MPSSQQTLLQISQLAEVNVATLYGIVQHNAFLGSHADFYHLVHVWRSARDVNSVLDDMRNKQLHSVAEVPSDWLSHYEISCDPPLGKLVSRFLPDAYEN